MLIPRVCVVCGAQFGAKPYEVKRGRGKCCSKACSARTAARPDQSGEANPNWKGGFTNTQRFGRHKEKYPEKYLARLLMTKAIRRGDLVKQPCEVCGSEEVEGHHDDYSKPLAVRWLCKTHHIEHHKLFQPVLFTPLGRD